MPGTIDGFVVPIGCTTEQKISGLQNIKDAMANCMILGLNDEIGFEKNTLNQLQAFYFEADAQIKKLQGLKLNRGAIA